MSLGGTLWLIALLAVLASSTVATVEMVQARLRGHKRLQQAVAMAISGQDYATAMKRRGLWRGVTRFRSPTFPGEVRFEVELLSNGRTVSTGYAGATLYRLEGSP